MLNLNNEKNNNENQKFSSDHFYDRGKKIKNDNKKNKDEWNA